MMMGSGSGHLVGGGRRVHIPAVLVMVAAQLRRSHLVVVVVMVVVMGRVGVTSWAAARRVLHGVVVVVEIAELGLI